MDARDSVRQLLEAALDPCVLIDGDFRVVAYNQAYCDALSLSPAELDRRIASGVRCNELLPLSLCPSDCIGRRALESRRPLQARASSSCPKLKDGLTAAALPIGDDLILETYRPTQLEAPQERLQLLEHQEAQINRREDELRQAQAQLVHQEKMSSLGRLVAGIAHELNNPINFVYGNVEFLGQYLDQLFELVAAIEQSEDLPSNMRNRIAELKEGIEFEYLVTDARKLIGSIRSGAERTASIVRDLKNFSRASGVNLQEMDLVAGIETTLNLLAPLLKGRITIERDFQASPPKVRCHASRVNQVFMNVLTNAAQAIEGNGTIRIGIHTCRNDEWLRITVSDNGKGIPEDEIARITDPFFTTKEVGEGTGLGLWISDSVVRAHGGVMTCESRPGEGSTFVVELPINADQPGAPEASASGATTVRSPRSQPGSSGYTA